MSVSPIAGGNTSHIAGTSNPNAEITGKVEGEKKKSRLDGSLALSTIQIAIGSSVQVGGNIQLATPRQVMGTPQVSSAGSGSEAKAASNDGTDSGGMKMKVGGGSGRDGWSPESLRDYVEEHPEFAAKAKHIAEEEGFTDLIPELEERMEEQKADGPAEAKPPAEAPKEEATAADEPNGAAE